MSTHNQLSNGKCYALLVSVGDYHEMQCANLTTYQEDVQLIFRGLTQGLKFDNSNIRTLGNNGWLSTREFAMAFSNFSKMLTSEDSFLLYFSGHGDGNALVFSDSRIRLQSILEVVEKLPAKDKIIILDCCYSGEFSTSTPNCMRIEDSVSTFIGKGTAVMASSAANEISRLGISAKNSLYTGIVSAAMMSRRLVRKRLVSLKDLNDEVLFMMSTWNEHHPQQAQHPVFRSNINGTVYFRVSESPQYEPLHVSFETQDYSLCSVKPLSVANMKRLRAVIMSQKETDIDLATTTKEVVAAIKRARVYSTQRSEDYFGDAPARAIWCYFGHDQSDIKRDLYYAYTIWCADNEAKQLYYKESSNSQTFDGICICRNPSYEMLRKIQQPTQTRDECILKTKKTLSNIVALAEQFISALHEVENQTTTVPIVKQNYEQWIRTVKKQYNQLADSDIASDDLYAWAQEVMNLAGTVLDLALLLDMTSNETFGSREQWLMNFSIRQYYVSLEKLKALEPFQ